MVEATVLWTTDNRELINTELVVYTNGSCENNGKADVKAGCGIWYGGDDPCNTAI